MTIYLEALLRQMNDSINAVAGTKTSGSIDGLQEDSPHASLPFRRITITLSEIFLFLPPRMEVFDLLDKCNKKCNKGSSKQFF